MNIDKYINMNREEFLAFLDLDHLIPIDNVIEYKGKKYKLSDHCFYCYISCARLYKEYPVDYNGPIEKEVAKQINWGTLSGISALASFIDEYVKCDSIKELEPDIKEVV